MLLTWIIPLLVFLAVVLIGIAVALVIANKRTVSWRVSSDAQTGGVTLTQGSPSSPVSMRFARKVGAAFALGKSSTKLRERLARAGFYGEHAPATFVGMKFMFMMFGLVAVTMLVVTVDMSAAIKIYLVLMGAGVMFFFPNFYLSHRLAKRTAEVRRHLPDSIDLLEICVSSGMGLDAAWNSVGDEIRIVSPVLADEFALSNLEMQLGATRAEALRHLSERTGADEFSSLVAMLVQSERFGTSIAEALSIFATSMRERRSQRAEETAEKMAVKLLFPLVLCIFPVMLIVMAGPAVLTIMDLIAE